MGKGGEMYKFEAKIVILILLGTFQVKGNHIDSRYQQRVLYHSNTSTFRNGDTIQHAKSKEEWIQACERGVPAWCYLDNDTIIGKEIGKLYNFFAIHDPRGILPVGYTIPTKEVARKLMQEDTALMRLALSHFRRGFIGNDSIYGGIRNSNGMFSFQKEVIPWWTSSIIDEDQIVFGDVYGLVYSVKFKDYSIIELDKCSGMYVMGVKEE